MRTREWDEWANIFHEELHSNSSSCEESRCELSKLFIRFYSFIHSCEASLLRFGFFDSVHWIWWTIYFLHLHFITISSPFHSGFFFLFFFKFFPAFPTYISINCVYIFIALEWSVEIVQVTPNHNPQKKISDAKRHFYLFHSFFPPQWNASTVHFCLWPYLLLCIVISFHSITAFCVVFTVSDLYRISRISISHH